MAEARSMYKPKNWWSNVDDVTDRVIVTQGTMPVVRNHLYICQISDLDITLVCPADPENLDCYTVQIKDTGSGKLHFDGNGNTVGGMPTYTMPDDLTAQELAPTRIVRFVNGNWAIAVNPWIQSIEGDLVPLVANAGIGSLDASPSYVAFGDVATLGVEGFISERDDNTGGGIRVVGFRNEDPNEPAETLEANAPVTIEGNQVAVFGQTLEIELQSPISNDHYLKLGPSRTLSDGRILAPVLLGPRIIYAHEQTATDTRDIELTQVSSTPIVSLTTDYNYVADDQFSLQLQLEETGGRTGIISIEIEIDGVVTETVDVPVTGGLFLWQLSDAIETPIASGVVVRLLAFYTQTHPQTMCWIRGSINASRIQLVGYS